MILKVPNGDLHIVDLARVNSIKLHNKGAYLDTTEGLRKLQKRSYENWNEFEESVISKELIN